MSPLPLTNIWIAAGDGDLTTVQTHIESYGMSPNAPDAYTYTPMHAAASYGHIAVLEYLISKGGDVNVADNDGDTPLYVVESIDAARWLVDHGALVDHRNLEGLSPAGHLEEEFPDIAAYLHSITSANGSSSIPRSERQNVQDDASTCLADQLMHNAAAILAADPDLHNDNGVNDTAHESAYNPEPALRAVVSHTVLQGVLAGYGLGASASSGAAAPNASACASTESDANDASADISTDSTSNAQA